MTNHPITPPPELVKQWRNEGYSMHKPVVLTTYVATRAAQWAADMELEACCEWLEDQLCMPPKARADAIAKLRFERRAPSLKEQALKELQMAYDTSDISMVHLDTIRRALEQLND